MKSFAQRLQHLMDLKKINQQGVADGIGVNRSRISLWLNQKTKDPRRETFQKLSDFFGCSIDWLAEGKGELFPSAEIKTAENVSNFQTHRNNRETDKTLEKLMLEKFKMQCGTVYFDEFFEYIADNYGADKAGVDQFFSELIKTHSNYRVWLTEKKETREDLQTGGRGKIAANGE